jgi:hypothetical protein
MTMSELLNNTSQIMAITGGVFTMSAALVGLVWKVIDSKIKAVERTADGKIQVIEKNTGDKIDELHRSHSEATKKNDDSHTLMFGRINKLDNAVADFKVATDRIERLGKTQDRTEASVDAVFTELGKVAIQVAEIHGSCRRCVESKR